MRQLEQLPVAAHRTLHNARSVQRATQQVHPPTNAADAGARARAWEVVQVFLRLGLTSFGGPIAHLAYFRDELVARRRWLDDAEFARLVALCQFLPGPASSQLGFVLGLRRAGWLGALSAFAAFTLPSAIALFCVALYLPALAGSGTGRTLVHAMKLVAVVVVAHGVWGMARTLAPDTRRRAIAVLAAATALAAPAAAGQPAAIMLGGVLGLLWCRSTAGSASAIAPGIVSRRMAASAATLFALGLAWSLWPRDGTATLEAVAAAHYQAGALVFGGGHVVLPLLDARIVGAGWLDAEQFLAGYGAAQAVPGPMFTLASFLGARIDTGAPAAMGSVLATLCIFLPGFLILVAAVPFWSSLALRPGVGAATAGVGAAVVGLLLATLYRPLWTGGVAGWQDVATIVPGLLFCGFLRRPVFAVLPWCVGMTFFWHWLH
jgi:chromate transporter